MATFTRHRSNNPDSAMALTTHAGYSGALDPPEGRDVGVLAVLGHRRGEVGEHDQWTHDLGVEHLLRGGDEPLVVEHVVDAVDVHLA